MTKQQQQHNGRHENMCVGAFLLTHTHTQTRIKRWYLCFFLFTSVMNEHFGHDSNRLI